ncbi:YggS family pyridoxal phosphate enzyme [Rhodoferax koreense]|uniref:Pyridoxal phosphate homeostasis protein n=1 Tax=Rhodoferax koreensis TaxID=1842727 RepID=A0A1P8K202_9BURK|nr:YggS family pyridoxal phosphate-dependent enzyme [Rhodoferax koreense]APW40030.1 YggS family pyridoxal phosphate enzyme [Rhodoferax koreense]
MTTIGNDLQGVRERIATACAQAGRDIGSVSLLAVSKTFDAGAVREAYAAGQTAFGENYLQEAVEKIAALRDLPLTWHCIGPIQSNKSRLVAEHFDWAHTVASLRLAQRLSDQRSPALPPLQICLQVNIDGGPNKSGLAPEEVQALALQVARLPRLQLRGLMTIPEPQPDFASALAVHQRSRALFDTVAAAGGGDPGMARFDTLSMGMTGDLEAAILAGSTMVRVGSAIFGGRPPARRPG